MKSFLLLFALLLSGSAFAQKQRPSIDVLNEKYGFRDLRFGADTADLKGRVFLMAGGNVRYYSRPSDDPRVGGSVVAISYGFYKGKFATVSLKAANKENGTALLAALIGTYGRPLRTSPLEEKYLWHAPLVEMTLDASPPIETQAIISSRPIMFQIEGERNFRPKKAASDL